MLKLLQTYLKVFHNGVLVEKYFTVLDLNLNYLKWIKIKDPGSHSY